MRSESVRVNTLAKQVAPVDCESVSSKSNVNSLRPRYTKLGVVNRPGMMKPGTRREETGISTCGAPRGDRRERAQKDTQRNLGAPSRLGLEPKECWE